MTPRVECHRFGPGANRHDSRPEDRPFKLRDLTGLVVQRIATGQPMDAAELYRELSARHRRELASAIDRARGPDWLAGSTAADRFARHVADLAGATP